jgi:NADPH-dependent curcumin reductase CurA
VGKVVKSKSDRFRPGDYVLSMLGWREYFLANPEVLTGIDPDIAPVQAYLGVLGLTGMTAYNGLLDIGRPVKGETLFVSAASGAVGSIVCQIGKIKGCRVVGSAGSPEKTAWLLEEAGIDAALNYKQVDNLYDELAGLCPQGIDVYYENVGGAHLEAALALMNNNGRIVLCGMISRYNDTQASPGPRNLGLAIGKRLTIRGFIGSDYADRMPQFLDDMGKWIKAGKIKWKETIVEGIENAPQAFIGLFKGENFGKMLVKCAPAE